MDLPRSYACGQGLSTGAHPRLQSGDVWLMVYFRIRLSVWKFMAMPAPAVLKRLLDQAFDPYDSDISHPNFSSSPKSMRYRFSDIDAERLYQAIGRAQPQHGWFRETVGRLLRSREGEEAKVPEAEHIMAEPVKPGEASEELCSSGI